MSQLIIVAVCAWHMVIKLVWPEIETAPHHAIGVVRLY